MDLNSSQEEFDLDQESKSASIDQQQATDQQATDNIDSSIDNREIPLDDRGARDMESGSQSYNYSQSQLQWMNRQVSNLERELLLSNNRAINNSLVSNWTKVILSALAVIIPGIGQIIGIIIGLVFVSNDIDADKRSFGAALLTVSVVAFIISASFWFIFALTFGPQLYY